MPDATFQRPSTPPDWGSAFAALGDATPPAGGWERVARALGARGDAPGRAPPVGRGIAANIAPSPRRRWGAPLWLASAAGIGAVAVVAMLLLRPQPERTDRPSRGEVAVSRPDATQAQPRPITTTDVVVPAASAAVSVSDRPRVAAVTAPPTMPSVSETSTRIRDRPLRAPRDEQVSVASSVAATDFSGPTTRPATVATGHQESAAAATVPSDDTALASLFVESARLEAVIALANDDSVASGSGLVLAGELRDRIGQIDAALAQPALDAATHGALWQQRIDALRDLAGLQSTQRWLAANGEHYDGALVSVH